jgi:hypothetical protein
MAGKILQFPTKQDDSQFITIAVGERSYRIRKEYQGKFFTLVDSLLRHLERKSNTDSYSNG